VPVAEQSETFPVDPPRLRPPRRRPRDRGRGSPWYLVPAIGVLLLLAPLGACVTQLEPGQEPLRPKPRDVATPDADSVTADRVTLFANPYPADRDASGGGDTIEAVVYLWDDASPVPIHDRGTLAIALFRVGGYNRIGEEPLLSWAYGPEEFAEREGRTLTGACYFFELANTYVGPDGVDRVRDFGVPRADLVAWFTDAETGRTISSGVSTIQLDLPLTR